MMNSLLDKKEFQKLIRYVYKVLCPKGLKKISLIEFGAGRGDTIVFTEDIIGENVDKYYAFDTFSGLPEPTAEDGGVFSKGDFSFSLDEFNENLTVNGVPLDKVQVFVGAFYDTLPYFKAVTSIEGPMVFMFDCDLYESTKQALNFFVDFFEKECIVIFDDWFSTANIGDVSGQALAAHEFMDSNKDRLLFEWLGTYKYYGRIAGNYFLVRKI